MHQEARKSAARHRRSADARHQITCILESILRTPFLVECNVGRRRFRMEITKPTASAKKYNGTQQCPFRVLALIHESRATIVSSSCRKIPIRFGINVTPSTRPTIAYLFNGKRNQSLAGQHHHSPCLINNDEMTMAMIRNGRYTLKAMVRSGF